MTDAERNQIQSVSAMLVEARESHGLSQKDVAEQLFLTSTFIRYIDNGEFNKIPKPAFIKGYLRSYARVVSLEGDEVVARYEEQEQDRPESEEVRDVMEAPVGAGNFSGSVVQTGVFGLIGVAIVAIIVWWVAADRDDAAPAVVVTQPPADTRDEMTDSPVIDAMSSERDQGEGEAPELAREAPAPVQDAAVVQELPQVNPDEAALVEDEVSLEGEVPSDTADDVIAGLANPEEAALVTIGPNGQVVNPSIRLERVREGDTSYITVYANGEDDIEFSFSGECWVEIDDANGEQIYGDLNRAGDVMTVYGVAPFDVLLGRAPAVRMKLNGVEVDLRPFTTGEQTARVRTARL